MKDTPLSNCERDFLLKAIEEKKVGEIISTRCRVFVCARAQPEDVH